MAEVKWIKIVTDIFDDEKMLLIESVPSADSIIVIWFKLLCLAGKNNNAGVFLLNSRIAYTDEMLATIFRRDINTVRLALKTFNDFGMVEIIDNVITIPNWDKHQSLDALEKRKERQKEYMRERRAKQKLLINSENNVTEVESCKANSKANCKANVSSLDKKREREREEEKDIDIDIDISISKDILVQKDFVPIIETWNNLGLSKIVSIKNNRLKLLNARINEYGIDEVMKAIENIKNSNFLKGQNNKNWIITFDWLIKPNNFIKVLEGNYLNKGVSKNGAKRSLAEELAEDGIGFIIS